MTPFFLIVLILLLVGASAFLSLSEIAFFSLPSSRVRAYRHHLDPRKRQISRLLHQSKNLLVTIFFLNTVVNVCVQNIASDLFDLVNSGWWLKVGVPLLLVLIFGELLPKYFGLIYNEKVSYESAPFYEWIQNISSPFRSVITELTNFFSRIFFFFLKVDLPLSKKELDHILKSSEGKGLVHKDEAELLNGYLSLESRQVKDSMITANVAPVYNTELPLSKLTYLFSEEKMDEVPVCDGSLDKFLGNIDVTDFLIHRHDIESPKDIIKLLYKPLFIPETTSLSSLLDQFDTQGENIAIVVDEYGTVTGMITKMVIINTMTKGVHEDDKQKEYTRVSSDAIIANGTMSIEEFSKLTGYELLTNYHSVTLAGWLIEKFGSIPKSGETLVENGFLFQVFSADETRIRKIYIQKIKKETTK